MSEDQSNPYMERITARMAAYDAFAKLHAHWSVRMERWLHRIGRMLDGPRFGFLYPIYDRLTMPLFDWLAERQRVSLVLLMSTSTERLYAAWKRQNGSGGGMGAVAPMMAGKGPEGAFRRGQLRRPGSISTARPEQQKKTPASATNTPGAVTNIQEGNADGTHCRP